MQHYCYIHPSTHYALVTDNINIHVPTLEQPNEKHTCSPVGRPHFFFTLRISSPRTMCLFASKAAVRLIMFVDMQHYVLCCSSISQLLGWVQARAEGMLVELEITDIHWARWSMLGDFGRLLGSTNSPALLATREILGGKRQQIV